MKEVTLGVGFAIGLAALLGIASAGSAQAPGHGGMPMGDKQAETKEERPHAAMPAMSEPNFFTNDDREPGGLIFAVKVVE